MKRGMYFARVLSLIGLVTAASVVLPSVSLAQVTNSTAFNVDIVMGRSALLTSDGNTVLFSASDLGVSIPGLLPLDLAQLIAADHAVPSYIQAHIGSLVGPDDYDYLLAGESLSTTGALLNVFGNVVPFVGDLFTNVTNDLLNGIPAGVSTNEIFILRANNQYSFYGSNATTTDVISAVVNVNFYEEDVAETVPEPSSLLLVTCGLTLLGCRYRRRR